MALCACGRLTAVTFNLRVLYDFLESEERALFRQECWQGMIAVACIERIISDEMWKMASLLYFFSTVF